MKNLILLFTVLLLIGCSNKKAETVVIVGSEGAKIHGKVWVEFGADGTYQPNYLAPGYIVVFRIESNLGKSFGKAGTVYRINDKLLLEEIDKFDLKLSDEDIFKEYLIEWLKKYLQKIIEGASIE